LAIAGLLMLLIYAQGWAPDLYRLSVRAYCTLDVCLQPASAPAVPVTAADIENQHARLNAQIEAIAPTTLQAPLVAGAFDRDMEAFRAQLAVLRAEIDGFQ